MFQYSFMQNAFMISILISILCPCIGFFLVLRRYSMIGDTLAHASLAGVAIGLLFNKNPIISSFVFTSFCGLLIEFLRDYFKKYAELILVVVLSLSVGIAITIMSSGELHANVNSFLFGSVLTVTRDDLYAVLALSLVSILTLIILYNKLVIIAFDEEAAKVGRINVKLINYIFAILVAATISVSMRIVGVLVLSSMIALPVATAMQLGKGFKSTLLYSVLFSVIDILLSLFISYYMNCAPGGITALISVALLALVILIKKVGLLLSKSVVK
ncbi:metal ABC transporter permease [Clostridium estertheticum]|uniref:Metal ABC transporter permease n=1 Tax=Clostridium estertheticum subsp. estertheticum TaxID=1552 RepID=A0A1J0GM89_9CLOT|nr:metal ABC transporter permease [Clostridium estertheticum]APC42064.1 metal ABC transporter permease [Clostridium estertheticum subsp. estertheticum]